MKVVLIMIPMIIYIVFLIFCTLYFMKMIWKNYLKDLPLRHGQNEVISTIVTLFIAVGQFLIPSIKQKLIIFLVFLLLLLLLYVIIGLHNKANHSGNELLFFQREIHREKVYIYLAIGLLLVTLFYVYFTT